MLAKSAPAASVRGLADFSRRNDEGCGGSSQEQNPVCTFSTTERLP